MKCESISVCFDDYEDVVFTENTTDCHDLHLVYRDGLACVNYLDENNKRVNHDYPISKVTVVHRTAN